MYPKSTQQNKDMKIDYPFANPYPQLLDDTQSYHSVGNDELKQDYFQQKNQFKSNNEFKPHDSTKNFDSKNINYQKRKAPLPPTYPYQQMKKLKQSLKIIKRPQNQIHDNKSINSLDSFVTVNQFQSICYEEGDYQKMINGIQQKNQEVQKNNQNTQGNVYSQRQIANAGSFRSIQYGDQQSLVQNDKIIVNKNQEISLNNKPIIKQSSLLNIAQLQDFQEQEQKSQSNNEYGQINNSSQSNTRQKYECFDQADLVKQHVPSKSQIHSNRINKSHQQQHQHSRSYAHDKQLEDQKSVEISHINQVLNKSQLMDHQILQLTKQLHKIQQSHEQIIHQISQQAHSLQKNQKNISSSIIIKEFQQKITKQLSSKYTTFQSKLKELQENQNNLNSSIQYFNEIIKKTNYNNAYLKKQVQYFKQKVKDMEINQKKLIEKQNQIRQLELNNSKNHSSQLYSYKKSKPKTYTIKPKAPNNQSKQSKKYKELTFKYSLNILDQSNIMYQNKQSNYYNRDKLALQQQWIELQTDPQNSPPQYQLIYSFQQNKSLFVIRIVDLIGISSSSTQSWRTNSNNRKLNSSSNSNIRKNYQYLIDFVDSKSQKREEQKLQSLTKQLIINLNEQKYECKKFTRKIQIFLMIKEDNTFIDLIKVIALPNPLAFYIEKRFNNCQYHSLNAKNTLNQQNSAHNTSNSPLQKSLYKNMKNLYKFMRCYIINIEHMADIQFIQKLMMFEWINTSSTPDQQIKYFSIKNMINLQKQINKQADFKQNSLKDKFLNHKDSQGQLFYVKIQDCFLQNKLQNQMGQKLDQKYRYSTIFKVGSTLDNQLLIDLIEFLTFLMVL